MPKEKAISFDDLTRAHATLTESEFAALEAKFWKQNRIDPEKDLYPKDVAEARFNAVLMHCLTNRKVT